MVRPNRPIGSTNPNCRERAGRGESCARTTLDIAARGVLFYEAWHTGVPRQTGRPVGRPFFMVAKMKDGKESNGSIAVFFCQQIDPEQDRNRRPIEKERGSKIRFYPLPCTGRVEALHFLRALEAGARKIYLVMCPAGACRYGQGNIRARKRLDYAKGLIREVGYSEECLEVVSAPEPLPVSIEGIVRPLLDRD